MFVVPYIMNYELWVIMNSIYNYAVEILHFQSNIPILLNMNPLF